MPTLSSLIPLSIRTEIPKNLEDWRFAGLLGFAHVVLWFAAHCYFVRPLEMMDKPLDKIKAKGLRSPW